MHSKELPFLSIVVPAFNEAQSLRELLLGLEKKLGHSKTGYEVVFINDGSTDTTRQVLTELQKKSRIPITTVTLRKRSGKSTALAVGFEQVKGDIIVTL